MKMWKFWLADILTIANLSLIFILAYHYLGYLALLWWSGYNIAYWLWIRKESKILRRLDYDAMLKMCEKPKGRWD